MNTTISAPAASGWGPLSLLNIPEAASALNISERALRHLIAAHEFPVVRISRSIRVRYRDIESWLDAHSAGGVQ